MFRVITADNFHPGDAEDYDEASGFATLDEATAACRRIVDRSLEHLHRPGMTADMLYSDYTDFGDDPFIVWPPDEPRCTFSAWEYAQRRAAEMCT